MYMEQYSNIEQIKKQEGQNKKPIYPSTVIQAVFDAESVKAKQGFIVKNDRITNVRIRAYLKSARATLTAQSTTNVVVTSNVNNISNGAYVIARLRSGEIPSGVFYNVQCTADNEVTFSFVNVTNSDISLPELQWDVLALEGQIIV